MAIAVAVPILMLAVMVNSFSRLGLMLVFISPLALAADNPAGPSQEDLSEFGDAAAAPQVAPSPASSPLAANAVSPAATPALSAASPAPDSAPVAKQTPLATPPAAPIAAAGASPAPSVAVPPPAPAPPVADSSPVPPPAIEEEPKVALPERKGPAEIEPPPPEILDARPTNETLPNNPEPIVSESTREPAPPVKQVSEAPPESDTPVAESDIKRELRYGRIYQKFNKQDIGDEKWSEIAGDKVAESYSLQDGDTLWDISSKLFGNAFYWPKVWELNGDITNPHDVRIGKALKFSPGSSTTAPSLNLERVQNLNITEATTDLEDTVADAEPTLDYDTIITGDSEGNQVPIPPGKKSRPVLQRIPPSFLESSRSNAGYDAKTGFAKDGLKRPVPKLVLGPVPSIVVEEEWERDGQVVEMEGDTTVASTYQNVVIRLSNKAQPGDFFTAFSTNGKVTDPTTGYTIGLELETRAEIQIEEAIEGVEDTYRAMVVYTALPVRLNDYLKAGRRITRSDFEMEGTSSSVAARIVNGENNKRFLFGLHGVVFIDKGKDDGLKVGDLLPVLKNIYVRNPNTALEFDSRPIGAIKVVEIESHVATAIIVSEQDAIVPGDMTALVSDPTFKSPANEGDPKPEDSSIGQDSD